MASREYVSLDQKEVPTRISLRLPFRVWADAVGWPLLCILPLSISFMILDRPSAIPEAIAAASGLAVIRIETRMGFLLQSNPLATIAINAATATPIAWGCKLAAQAAIGA